jgi:hypothetical protein
VRERRAFQLVVVSGTAAAVAVVTGILAIIGALGFGIPLLAVVVAVIAGLLFKRTVS